VDEVGEPSRFGKYKVRTCAARRSSSTGNGASPLAHILQESNLDACLQTRAAQAACSPHRLSAARVIARWGSRHAHVMALPERARVECCRAPLSQPRPTTGLHTAPHPELYLGKEAVRVSIYWLGFKVRHGVAAAGRLRTGKPHFWTLTAARLRGLVPPRLGSTAVHLERCVIGRLKLTGL